jgi:hypothetical protein
MKRLAFLLALPLGGCVVGTIAHTAADVVTLPVRVASAGVDAATTSQAEADQKRGRAIRKAEEARGRQLREADERCRKGRPQPGDDCRMAVPR